MKNRFKLLIMVSAFLCLLLAQAAPGDVTNGVVKTLYVDGAKIGQALATQQLSFPYSRLTIAAEGTRWYRYGGLVGNIDEFAIYASVLPDANIAAHYSASDTNSNYYTAVQKDHPVLWLRFEDASSDINAPAANSGSLGSAYNGAYIGDVKYGNVTLVQGVWPGTTAADFNGAADGNGTCVDVNDALGSLNLMEATIEFWVQAQLTSPPQDAYPRFFQHNNGSTLSYGAMYAVSTWEVGVMGGGSTSPLFNYTLLNGNWHHVVITYHEISSSAANYYNEVMADDPCLYLRFGDDPNGYYDSSSHHYWVEYGNGTRMVSVTEGGGIGNCIYLPGGGGSYVAAANRFTAPPLPTVGHSHSYAFAPNDITFEVWVRSNKLRDAVDGYGVLFNQSTINQGDSEQNAPSLGKDTGDFFRSLTPFGGSDGSGMGYMVYTISVGAPLGTFPFDDQWHHIVLVYHTRAGNNNHLELIWWKDANLVKDKIYPNDPAYSGPTLGDVGQEMDHIVIGGSNNRSNVQARWGGYYDEFAIYGKALTPDRVLAHYQAAQPHNCAEKWSRGQGRVADRDRNCKLNFDDFAGFATDWRKCNDPNTAHGCPDCNSASCPPWW